MRSLPLNIAAVVAILTAMQPAIPAKAAEPPPWLPRYNVAINLDVPGQTAFVRLNMSWMNRHQRSTNELVFNVHSAYQPPKAGGLNFLMLGKMLEAMRLPPREGIYNELTVDIRKVSLVLHAGDRIEQVDLQFAFRDDLQTALVVKLPNEVKSGESVEVAIDFVFKLPQKQGRWGQWKGVTVLSNWLPVLAYYDEKGWRPTPFIPWHQPFFNEAGVYNVHLRLPADQKVASSGPVSKRVENGAYQELWIGPITTREFTIVASARFEEYVAWAGDVRVSCMAFPEHEFYGKEIARISARAVETYTRWFGPYPNKQLVLAESYFGWNGNECSGLIMIDERVFNMPHMGEAYVEYLVSHETCHQWFYNVIGTDGYRETWMDEAFANFFAHRLLDGLYGKNNALFKYPDELQWLPKVNRQDYRFGSTYGVVGRNQMGPPCQEMEKYGHVGNLFASCYDRGAKILMMIEDRLGPDAFFDFLRGIYQKYYFKVIFVDDFQRELEAYTGQSWADFFQHWLHDKGLTDWSIQSVSVTKVKPDAKAPAAEKTADGLYKTVVYLKQKADYDEPTTLGLSFGEEEKYPLRLPVNLQLGSIDLEDPPTHVESLPDHTVRVEVLLPQEPTQIAVDPDQILFDENPANNYWKPRYHARITPLYTFLDETDLTGAYDRWNFTVGPWVYGPSYADPWFTRTSVLGVRAGAFRTEEFTGGVYAGYRTDYRDFAAGIDLVAPNFLFPCLDTGFQVEKSLGNLYGNGGNLDMAVFFQRYVINPASGMYMPPMHYIEGFMSWTENLLPVSRTYVPGAERFDKETEVGLHYHLDLLTPYWNPDNGFKLDVTHAIGPPILGQPAFSAQTMAQFSFVYAPPSGLGYLSETRLAYRAYGAYGTPSNAQLFTLGGNLLFRGFDMAERQGNALWIGSMEWRLPIVQDVEWDTCDHVVGLRNLGVALFSDVGDIYQDGKSVGNVAYCAGVGLRAEFAWFSFIERTTFRLDFAKTLNANTPIQMWVGIVHPF